MEKQISAVDWLIDQITLKKLGDNSLFLIPIIIGDLIEQAKELEKQQIIDFSTDCIDSVDCFFDVEKHYNKTFGNETND